MTKVKKIKVLSYAKFQAIVMSFAGIVGGLIYSVGGTFYDLNTVGLNHGTALAYFAILVMPIYFGVFGYITGIVGAILYNLTTRWFGGIKIDFKV